jgi:hypothetical protein
MSARIVHYNSALAKFNSIPSFIGLESGIFTQLSCRKAVGGVHHNGAHKIPKFPKLAMWAALQFSHLEWASRWRSSATGFGQSGCFLSPVNRTSKSLDILEGSMLGTHLT